MKKLLAASAVLVAVTLPNTAYGLAVTVRDTTTSPAAGDVEAVTYTNAEKYVTTTVHVEDLQRRGKLVTFYGAPNGDVAYLSTAWIKKDGSLGKRLSYRAQSGTVPRRCPSLKATWAAGANTIRVAVPHSCMPTLGFQYRLFAFTRLTVDGHADQAARRTVARGDSPRCVTQREYNAASGGMSMARVHEIWDTTGHLTDRMRDAQGRGYKICNVAGTNVFAEYSKHPNGDWYLYFKRANAS